MATAFAAESRCMTSSSFLRTSGLFALALITGACSLNDPGSAQVTTIDVETSTTLVPEHMAASDLPAALATQPSSIDSATAAPSTTAPPATAPSTTAAPATEDPTSVAGEPLDYGPAEGTALVVVGVEHDDVLNFRVDPSPTATIVATAAPLADHDIMYSGASWSAPSGVWWLVTIDGQTLWANQSYLAAAGDNVDVSIEVVSDLPGAEYEVLLDAAMAAAGTRVTDGGPEPRFAQVNEALLFDGEGVLMIDVLDLGDDSVKGERVRVTVETIFDEESGEPGAQDVIGVRIVAVSVTPLCGRGVTGGLCL